MNRTLLNEFAAVPQPPMGQEHFINALKSAMNEYFSDDEKCCGTAVTFSGADLVPETALASLRRVLKAKGVEENAQGLPVTFALNSSWEKEEFEVAAAENSVSITAADEDGLRRAEIGRAHV